MSRYQRCQLPGFAEELALHLAVDEDAPAALEMHHDGFTEEHATLPTHRDDLDWDACADSLFQDSDIMLLYNPGLDGTEDPDAELNRTHGIGDMRPGNWFVPFLNVTPRIPDRGYRR
ncbi:MAG: hypothetical protein ABJB47_06130 [Actinomycetota bacterium]